MVYSEEEIQNAKQLVQDLESFSNRDIGHVANLERVTNNSRNAIIAGLLVKEFGPDIFKHNVYNPFGNDAICTVTDYRKSSVD